MKRARLVLADDHTLVVEGLTRILEPEFELVGTAADGRSLLQLARKVRPDVVLMDISMPVLNGIDATRELSRSLPGCKVVIVTMHAEPAFVGEAFRAGASGYVLKRSAASELVTAIREVLQGRSYITPLVTRDTLARFLSPPGPEQVAGIECLTPRQRQVLQLVAEGRTSKEIAAILSLSVKTVEFHRIRLIQHLNLHSTAELTRFAIQHGLLPV